MAPTNKNKRLQDNDQDSDTDSNNKRSYNSCNNWPRFLSWSHQVKTSHWVNCYPLVSRRVSRQWLEPSKALKGWGTDLSWWSAQGNRRQWVFSRPLDLLIDQYVFPFTKHWNSSRGVICCCELSSVTEMKIKTELQAQGVVEVRRVMVNRDTEKVPTNTLFLTFNTPDLPEEITVSYLKALFVPNLMHCFNCDKSGHTSQRCKVAA